MQAIKPETSRKLANMSFLCAIFIVCIHIQRPTDWGCALFERWIVGGISQIGVPFFFIASGFLLMNHADEKGWWQNALKKRFFTLIIPFFTLNILYFPIKYTCHYIGYKYFGADHSNPIMELTLKNFLISISPIPIDGGPVNYPLWYVRALVYLVCFSPLYVWLLRKSRWVSYSFVVTVFGFWLLQNTYLCGSYEYSLRCLFYFSLGITLRFWGNLEYSHAVGVLYALLGLALSFINNIPNPTLSFLIRAVQELSLIAGVWSLTPSSVWPSSLTKNSFAIYVIHVPLIYLGGTMYKALHLTNIASSTIGVLIFLAAYVILSCYLGNSMRNKYPKLATYILGGR